MWPFARKKKRKAASSRASSPFGFRPGKGGARKSKGKAGAALSVWRWRLRVFVLFPAVAALIATTAAGLLFVHYSTTFPDPLSLRHKERAPIIRILARDGSVLAERGAAHDYMPLDLLPRHVTDAVVATEDRRFYEHGGLDPYGLVRAMFANLRAGRYVQGGSTLTQQLAKNLFLTLRAHLEPQARRTGAGALARDAARPKHDILELYLNRVYFGAGAYGIEAAAQRYFDKSARELTLAEAAVIAGLLKAPSKYSPLTSPGPARTRGRVVLQQDARRRRHRRAGRRRDASRADRQVRIVASEQGGERASNTPSTSCSSACRRCCGNGHAEVIVETTIDARAAASRPGRRRASPGTRRRGAHASQAGVVVLDTEGGIAALVGGRSYAESQFNRAIKSRRQPGSAFKPFVYLAALEAGYTPDSTVYDLPVHDRRLEPAQRQRPVSRGRSRCGRRWRNRSTRSRCGCSTMSAPRKVVAVAHRLGVSSDLRRDAVAGARHLGSVAARDDRRLRALRQRRAHASSRTSSSACG